MNEFFRAVALVFLTLMLYAGLHLNFRLKRLVRKLIEFDAGETERK